MPNPSQNVFYCSQSLFRVDHGGKQFAEIAGDRLAIPDRLCQLAKSLLARSSRKRLFLGLEWQIQIFQSLWMFAIQNGVLQLIGELTLDSQVAKDRLLTVSKVALLLHPLLNLP